MFGTPSDCSSQLRIKKETSKGHKSARTCVRSGRKSVQVAADIRDRVAKAFQSVYSSNPLSRLSVSDRTYLCSLLLAYDYKSRTKHGEAPNAFLKELDSMSKTAADAAKLGARLKSQIFEGDSSEALRPFTAGFEDLPMRLIGFSKTLGEALNSFGKPGRKDEALATQGLIQASEFVRLKSGRYNDEHLAGVFQIIARRPISDDFSGAAIRKKRLYLKKHYPVLYDGALRSAKGHS